MFFRIFELCQIIYDNQDWLFFYIYIRVLEDEMEVSFWIIFEKIQKIVEAIIIEILTVVNIDSDLIQSPGFKFVMYKRETLIWDTGPWKT